MELKDLLSMIDTRAELLLEELGLAQLRAANEREWSDAPRAAHRLRVSDSCPALSLALNAPVPSGVSGEKPRGTSAVTGSAVTATGRLRHAYPGQHIAAIGDQAQGLQDQQGGNGQDDNRQQANIGHAAAPRLLTRSDNCWSAVCTLFGGSTGSIAWLWRATLVILAIRSISTVPAVT